MVFSFSDEQLQFRDTLQRFFLNHSPPGEVRRLMEAATGFDPLVLEKAYRELGIAGIQIPERYGGLGFSYVELCIVLEEMGRVLFCAPYFSTMVLSTNALINGADEPHKQYFLPRLAAGELIVALAVTEARASWEPADIEMTATLEADSHFLNGTKTFVIDGSAADFILVAAREPGSTGDAGVSLFVVDGSASGLSRRELEMIDPTRRQAELVFDNVEAELIGEPGGAAEAIRTTAMQSAVALANEMVGGCQALLDSAVEYAKLRMQFGRLIGSFQAIKHKCADLLLDVELAKSAAYYAAAQVADNGHDIAADAALAKAVAADTYTRTATECIQIHGGIGFTWDHDTHLWFKRARSSEVLLGAPAHHREQFMRLLEADT